MLPSGEILDLHSTLSKSSAGPSLRSLFVGSEGTLGIVTDVCFKLHPAPASTELALFSVPSLSAASSLQALAASTCGGAVSALEIMDDRVLSLVSEQLPLPLPAPPSSYHVLVELHSHAASSARESIEALAAAALSGGAASDGVLASSGKEAAAIWGVREACGVAVNAFPVKFKYDFSLPLAKWEEIAAEARGRVEGEGGRVVTWGHLGDRNIHLNVVFDADSSRQEELAGLLEPFVYDFVEAAGGSISAEHGIGVCKAGRLDTVAGGGGERGVALLRQIKAAFDPLGIMNPGKLLQIE